MYAPRLQSLSKDERWALGFAHRVDRRADAALAEIRSMADKARTDLGLWRSADGFTDIIFLQSGTDAYYGTGQSALRVLEDRIERLSWAVHAASFK
jgi:hypothetical protein